MDKINKLYKICVIGNSFDYLKFLNIKFEIVDKIDNADIILFTGGEDVDPSLYGENKGKYTYINKLRDLAEEHTFESSRDDQLKIGICRGSQFLTVMNGGKLIQHVNNHGISGIHKININDEKIKEIEITSTHHQMMYPFNLNKEDYEIIGYSDKRATMYLNGDNQNINIDKDFVECEIVYYNKTNSLCIQGHPEMMDKNKYKETITYLNNLILNFL